MKTTITKALQVMACLILSSVIVILTPAESLGQARATMGRGNVEHSLKKKEERANQGVKATMGYRNVGNAEEASNKWRKRRKTANQWSSSLLFKKARKWRKRRKTANQRRKTANQWRRTRRIEPEVEVAKGTSKNDGFRRKTSAKPSGASNKSPNPSPYPDPWNWDNRGKAPTTTGKRPRHPKPWVNRVSTTEALMQLNNMGAVMAFKPTPNGGFCRIDVRGRTKSTPSFVKPAGGRDPLPKSTTPACSSQEQKAFQQTAKKMQIKNGVTAQKTSGAILGALAKSAGIGCVFGAGIAWIADMFSGDSEDKKTQASANCVDCANKKSKEAKEVEEIRAATIVAAGAGGGIATGIVGHHSLRYIVPEMEVAAAKKILITDETNQKLKPMADPEYAKKKVAFFESQILKLKERQAQKGLDRNVRHNIEIEIAEKNSAKSFWNKVIDLQQQSPKTSGGSALINLVEQRVTKKVSKIPDKEVVAKLDSMQQRRLNMKFNEGIVGLKSMVSAGVSALAGGIAGAIVCEDGTTYLLTDNPKTDI